MKRGRLTLKKLLMMKNESLTFDQKNSCRIDQYLKEKYPDYSRAYFQNLIESGDILVNQKKTKPSQQLKIGDNIKINFVEKKPDADLKPEKIDLDIIYEDKKVIVINKQPGLVVHPAAGNKEGTLVNALLSHFPKIKSAVYDKNSEISKIRPGLVHRLDKDTSGVMIVAKNARAMHSLSRQIQNRDVTKNYIALCFGVPKEKEGDLINHLGRHPKNRKIMAEVGSDKGKIAISQYQILETYLHRGRNLSLLEFQIRTGRTHQIRVQSKLIGCPIIGDTVYGSRESIKISKEIGAERQMLHALVLSITLPSDNKPSNFTASVAKDFAAVINRITPS